jgi:tetratricopeptide (TPR) repeat protein
MRPILSLLLISWLCAGSFAAASSDAPTTTPDRLEHSGRLAETSGSAGVGTLPRPHLQPTTSPAVLGRMGIRLLETIGWSPDDLFLFFERPGLTPEKQKALEARRHYWMGQFYLERDEYAHAQGEFRAALELQPDSLPIQLGLADALVGAQQFDEAEKVLTQALEKHPDSVHALILQAQLAMSQAEAATARKDQEKYLDTAIAALQKAKALQPRNLDVLKELVAVYTAKRDVDKLIDTYREIVAATPKDTYSAFVLANLLAKRGMRQEAASLYEKVIEQRRDFVNAYVYLGLVQEEMGQTAQAIETYKKALLIEPRNVQLQRLFEALLTRATQGRGPGALLEQYKQFAHEYPYSTEIQRLYAEQLVRDKQTSAAIEQYKRVIELDPENVEALVSVAGLLAQNGRYDEAGEYYSRAMEVAPERTDIYEAIATTFANVKDRARAIQVLKKALRFNPNVPLLYVNVASLLEQDKRVDEAKEILQQGIAKVGEKPEFYVALGELAEHAKKTDEAITCYQKAVTLAPTNRMLLARYMKLLAENKQWNAIDAAALELSDKTSDKADLYAIVGETFVYEGELERAAQWFEKALAEAPERFPLYARLVQIYNVRDEHDKAFAIVERAMKQFPDNPDAQRMLADTFVDAKQYDKAIPIYRKLIEREPTKLDGYRLLVDALNKAGRYEEAMAAVEQAEKAVGKNEETRLLRAISLYSEKRYEAAESTLKEMLRSRGRNRDVVYYLLGSIYLEQKKYEAAESALKKAIEINPLNDSALNALGYMYADLGRKLPEARELITRALDINPNAPHILDSLGWVYYREGKLDLAREYVEKAWKLMGDDPEVLKHLGDIYFRLGQRDKAVDFWKRSLLLDSNQRDVRARISDVEKKKTDR